MSLDPELERPHVAEDPAFSDAVTCAFADEAAGVQGTVRIGLTAGAASGLIMIFADGQQAIAQAEGAIPVDGTPTDYADVAAAGIDHRIVEPHRRWTVAVTSAAGRLELEMEAVGPPFVLDPKHPAARRGGMAGYEQPCRISGTLELFAPAHEPRTIRLDGVGQRGHQWGAPDWTTLELSRTLTGWFGEEVAFNISALRPLGAHSHADEIAWSSVSRAPTPARDESADEEDADGATEAHDPRDPAAPATSDGPDDRPRDDGAANGIADLPPVAPVAVDAPEPRISTTTDAGGRHTHATVELWESDEGPVWTATGEVLAGTTIELGRLRLDMAFFRWRLRGRTGVGRYDVLRRVDEE